MSQKFPRGLARTGSDGVIKTTSVTKTTQRQHSSAESPRKILPAPTIKSLTSVFQNGSNHSVTNGGSHDRGSVKKSPLLPPAHLREKKSNSSDSSTSSNNSAGSVYRTVESAAQTSNQDVQLKNSSKSGGSAEPKRPLMPPTIRSTPSPITSPTSTMTSSQNGDDGRRLETKPLPLQPEGSWSPSNTSRNSIKGTDVSDKENLENGTNSGQTPPNRDTHIVRRDTRELETENEALRRRIQQLEDENDILRSTPPPSVTPLPRSSGSNTPTPYPHHGEDIAGRSLNGSQGNPETGASHSPSPLPPRDSPCQSTADEQGSTPLAGGMADLKLAARMKLSRVLERVQASSPDAVDPKKISQPIAKSVTQTPPPESVRSSLTSPLSPLSPAPSTPSPTSLVSFGLASQAKRNAIKRPTGRGSTSRESKSTTPTSVSSEPVSERKSKSPDTLGSVTEEEREIATPQQELKLGQFARKSNKSIVSKVFQRSSADESGARHDVETNREQFDNPSIDAMPADPSSDRGKESLSSESDEVFTSSISRQPEPASISEQPVGKHREAKSESHVLQGSSVRNGDKKRGVVSKRVPVKSDVSWIKKAKSGAERDESGSQSPQRCESPSQPQASPPLRPYRSHQILSNASSNPPPPPSSSSSSKQPLPSSQLARPGLTPSSSKPLHHRSHNLIIDESGGAGDKKRGRGASISGKSGFKLKRGRKKSEEEGGMSRSMSDESLRGSLQRGVQAYSSQRIQETKTERPPRPQPPLSRHVSAEGRTASRPVSVMVEAESPPRGWDDGGREEDFSMSCTVPGGPTKDKSPKRKRANDPSQLTKKGSLFSRLRVRPRDKDLPTIPARVAEEEDGGDSDSSSEDEKGATIKFKPKLRPVSVRRPSQVEDDFDLSYPHLFERVFVVTLKPDPTDASKLTTEVTYTFPPRPPSETGRDETMESIPQFCFPDIDRLKPTTKFKSETFSFVLTNMMGNRKFGYCRRLLPAGKGPRLPEVTCLISPLGCFSLYEKILDHVEERRQVSTTAVFTFLKAIVANPFPKPGRSVQVRAFSARGGGMETVTFTRPLDSRLEHVDFSILFSTLPPRKIIQLISSMFMERRIILCSSNLSLLTGCAHALLALLYPFEWQHVFIPVLPGALIDFCCSPLPYLMGMHPSLIPALDEMETMEEALVVDLDKKKFVKKIGDESSILPSKLFQYLEHTLGSPAVTAEYQKPSGKKSSTSRADEIITNTFMIFFVYLYGDYRQYMRKKADGSVEFAKKEYEKKFSSKSIRRFLEAFHMTQMFDNFAEQRENPLKSEMTSQSTFERSTIHVMKDRCMEIEIFSSKSKISRWRLRRRI